MLFDSKGKLFGKISIVDILVILIVLGGIGGVAYKMSKSNAASVFKKADKVQVVYYSEKIPEYAAKAIKAGDVVKDKTGGTSLGKVTEVVTGNSIDYGYNSEGRSVASPKQGYVSIKVTTEVQGTLGPNGVTVGANEYNINKTSFEVKFGIASFYTTIYDIKKLED